MSVSSVGPKHARRGRFARIRRSKDLKGLLTKLQTALNNTGAGKAFTASASANLTVTAHGYKVGEGPFLVTNSGGALPSPLVSAKFYYVIAVPDVNTINIATDEDLKTAIVMAGAGTGTHTITKASSLGAVYELLKKRGARFMRAATDVDGI